MGDPKKIRKTYRTPSHPWQKQRIVDEDELLRNYGIKNKTELWKMKSRLENFKYQSKRLVALRNQQSEKEKAQLITRLKSIGLLKEDQGFDDVLGFEIKDILERRLQTLVHRKGLAKTMHESRQFITYGHIMVNNKEITSPSYIVSIAEEPTLAFNPKSKLVDPNHLQRVIQEKKAKPKRERKEDPRGKKRFNRRDKKGERR